MRLLYNFLVFFLSLEFAAYLLPFFVALPTYTPLINSPTDISTSFSVETFAYLTVGGAAIGLAALLLRAGTYAFYAMLLWAVGVMLPIVRNFLLAIPILVNAIIPPEINPVAAQGLPNPITLVVTAMTTFAGFMFLMEFVAGRNVT